MGNYVFTADALEEAVTSDRDDSRAASTTWAATSCRTSSSRGEAGVYDFKDNDVPGATDRDRGYWRDVGTIESYYDAHMDLISIHPVFNLYNYEWPIYTQHSPYPPAKFVHGSGDRIGEALNSAVSPGVVVSGAHIYASVLSPLVHVHSYASIQGSVLLDGVEVGRHAQIRRAIIDKNVVDPRGLPDRHRPRARPGPRLPRHRDGHRRRRQGPGRHPVTVDRRHDIVRERGDPAAGRASASRSRRSTRRGRRSGAAAATLEEMGVDVLLNWDHFFPLER